MLQLGASWCWCAVSHPRRRPLPALLFCLPHGLPRQLSHLLAVHRFMDVLVGARVPRGSGPVKSLISAFSSFSPYFWLCPSCAPPPALNWGAFLPVHASCFRLTAALLLPVLLPSWAATAFPLALRLLLWLHSVLAGLFATYPFATAVLPRCLWFVACGPSPVSFIPLVRTCPRGTR